MWTASYKETDDGRTRIGRFGTGSRPGLARVLSRSTRLTGGPPDGGDEPRRTADVVAGRDRHLPRLCRPGAVGSGVRDGRAGRGRAGRWRTAGCCRISRGLTRSRRPRCGAVLPSWFSLRFHNVAGHGMDPAYGTTPAPWGGWPCWAGAPPGAAARTAWAPA